MLLAGELVGGVGGSGQSSCLWQSTRYRVNPSDFQEEPGEDQDERQTLLFFFFFHFLPLNYIRGSMVRWKGWAAPFIGFMAFGQV